jgi:hypothetical protein
LRGWFARAGRDRIGRRQRAIRRALTVYATTLTTHELFQFVFPGCSDRTGSRLFAVRRAAERFATRVTPRSRPLRWELKDDIEM